MAGTSHTLLDRPAGRAAVFAVLYASEGAPIGFIWWALPTLMREAGVPVVQITALTSMLVLPWVFKFLWAPIVDALQTPRWGYRASVVAMQTVMSVALVPLIWLDPVAHLPSWTVLLAVHAVAASTQDVAIDALAIRAVPPSELGRLNGAMQAGMLVGRSLFGGGVLLLSARLGRAWIIAALVAWIVAALGWLLFVRLPDRPAGAADAPRSMARALAAVFRVRTTWVGLAFALVSGSAFEATGQLAGPYLVDRGVSSDRIGLFFGLFAVTATLAGGLIGGWLSDRWGRTRSVGVFLCGVIVTVAMLGWVDLHGGTAVVILFLVLTAMYFCVGLFTVASYALFMNLTQPRLGATQFSTFMAATNGCESWSAWAGGRVVGAYGYSASFLVMSVVSLGSLGLLVPLRGRRADVGRRVS
jgi:PAT family beta-lactamase induction signal transducer AmpG